MKGKHLFPEVGIQLQGKTLPVDKNTHKPLYKIINSNTVLDTTQIKDGFQRCVGYIEK